MERKAYEGQHARDGAGVVRDRGVREVLRREAERPVAVRRPVRFNDRAAGPVRAQVHLLVERVGEPSVVVGETARRTVVRSRVIGDVVPIPIPEFDEGVQLQSV